MNIRNIQKRQNMNLVNQQFQIPYRNWNVYLDGPCTKGYQLDEEVVDYLRNTFLTVNKNKSRDLYILGVRYYMSAKPKPKPGKTSTNMSLFDTQLGISETCVPSNKDNMLGCALRGLREEVQIDIRSEPIHTIIPPTPPHNKPQNRFKYIYHIGSFLDYELLQTPINAPHNNAQPVNKNNVKKTLVVIIGELQYLLPILQNFNLNQMSAVKDSIVYPVLYPLYRLTYPTPQSFLQVRRNVGSNLQEYIDLLYPCNSLFEYPEEIILPYFSPNFYQLIKFALQNAEVPNFIYRNSKSFENRLNLFMKYVELERLKSLDIKLKNKKRSSMSTSSNLGTYYQSVAQPISTTSSPLSTPSSTPPRHNKVVSINPFDLFINLYKAHSNPNPFENNPFENSQSSPPSSNPFEN